MRCDETAKKRSMGMCLVIFGLLATMCWTLPGCRSDNLALDDPAIEREVDHLMSPLVWEGLISGTILIAEEGRIRFCKGYGKADLEHNWDNDCGTIYRIGSITKPFTALAVMQLVQSGLVDLDSTVSCYLTGFRYGDSVTVRQLLSHTSGLQNFVYLPDYVERSTRPHSIREVMDWFDDAPLLFEPGEGFHYSSSGYVVLAALIEAVSHQSYGAYIENHICQPAGMMRTGVDSNSLILPDRAVGYTRQPYGGTSKATYQALPFGIGHGGMYSTALDLYAWERALRSGELLDQQLQAAMEKPGRGDYGLGWMVAEEYGHPVRMHGGAISGYMSELRRFLDIDVVIIGLFNFETLLEQDVSQRLTAIALGKPWSPMFVSPSDSAYHQACRRFEGVYQLEPGYDLVLETVQGTLTMAEADYVRHPALVLSDNRLFSKEMNAVITLRAATGSRPATLEVLQGLLYWEAVKIR